MTSKHMLSDHSCPELKVVGSPQSQDWRETYRGQVYDLGRKNHFLVCMHLNPYIDRLWLNDFQWK